jgi:GTP-binding protein
MPAKPPIEPPHVVSASFFAASKTGELPPPIGIEIAFAGRSNVGKSTLLNALTGRRGLVRTSSTPGCTRQITLFEVVLKDGARITFADLPGFGFAKRSKDERKQWGPMMDDYLLGRATLVAVVLLIDVRRGVQQEERDLLEMVASPSRVSRAPLTVLTVATKLDKLPRAAHGAALQRLAREVGMPVLGFSSKDPATRGPVWAALLRTTGLGQGTVPAASLPRSSRSQSP